MGYYLVRVIQIINGERVQKYESTPFFRTSLHAAKVEASQITRFRFQKIQAVCDITNQRHWTTDSDILWSKFDDDYIMELHVHSF